MGEYKLICRAIYVVLWCAITIALSFRCTLPADVCYIGITIILAAYIIADTSGPAE